MHDVKGSAKPADAAQEQRAWYQYYFCTPRGVAGLMENRRDIARLLWQLWLVGEPFDAALFEESARIVRQSGLCRGGDSLLPGALRLRGRRSLARRHRDAACRKAADHRADHCSARRSGRSSLTVIIRRSCEAFHRPVSAYAGAARRPRAAPGCTAGRSRMPCWNLRQSNNEFPAMLRERNLPNQRVAPSFVRVVNQLKGGDPVSHCHSPITASWIAASGVRS